MNYAKACEYLLRLKSRGVALGLERMQAWGAALGNPHFAVPCIHLAGTNGKGSVAAILEAILRVAGWRVGLYTSPHLVRLGERIQINREPLSNEQIAGWVGELAPIADRLASAADSPGGPSYFEFMTGMAFAHFQREKCDIAVIETGLGGRLDATNVVAPLATGITSIGFDHCEMLGGTLDAIAREKAGIIKPNTPLAIGILPSAAETVVREVAAQKNAAVSSVRETFGDDPARYPRSALAGVHQRINAATATLLARSLSAHWRIDDATIAAGLAGVNWPGRWQRFEIDGRLVVVDSSHNEEGARSLSLLLDELCAERGRPPIVVVGVLGANRARPLLEVVTRRAAQIVFVVPDQPRACSFEDLESLLSDSPRPPVSRSSVSELFPSRNRCALGSPSDTIVVTGSIYLAGEVLARLEGRADGPESRLQDF